MSAEKNKRKTEKWQRKYGGGSKGSGGKKGTNKGSRMKKGSGNGLTGRGTGKKEKLSASVAKKAGYVKQESAVDRWREGKSILNEEEQQELEQEERRGGGGDGEGGGVSGGFQTGTFSLQSTWIKPHLEESTTERVEGTTNTGEDSMTPGKNGNTGASLLDGQFDEEANRREFQEALNAWRKGKSNTSTSSSSSSSSSSTFGTSTTMDGSGVSGSGRTKTREMVSSTGQTIKIVDQTKSLLDGNYDEEANRMEFQKALEEWRKGKGKGAGSSDSSIASDTDKSSSVMEVQTEGGETKTTNRKTDFDFDWDQVPEPDITIKEAVSGVREKTYFEELLEQRKKEEEGQQ
eukprot:TRINITY_DN3530_c0_g1_i5.p2 TRINITY_DN3530_c0_g1~~TRINITY_DN3530_c0_g1_i5.p2  ORF type:complete len:347 (-),score=132.70 TRINITY_DN3530_c0_g1_i5:2306-3346(-)